MKSNFYLNKTRTMNRKTNTLIDKKMEKERV
jgi:hypothetical protein